MERVNQEQKPNFRDNGRFFLVRCFRCNPEIGRENVSTAVASGECAHCGWKEMPSGIVSEQVITWQHDETGMTFTKNVPLNAPIPAFPRRSIVKIEPLFEGFFT